MILLTGASGQIGGPALRALLAQGRKVRAMTSNARSGDRLRAAGATEVLVGDLRDDADVERAVRNVDCIVHIPPNLIDDEHVVGDRLIAAAERAGVAQFVYISCFHAHPSDIPGHHHKLLVEDALYKSQLEFVILEPSMFMQNLLLLWPMVEASGTLAWPWNPDRKLATIDTEDVGLAVAAVAGAPRFNGGTYELSSDRELTVSEMAEIIAEASGRPIRAGRTDPAVWGTQMEKTGMSPWVIENVMAMSRFHDDFGYRGGNGIVFEAITGRKPVTYAEFVTRFLGEKVAASEHAVTA